MQQHPDEHSTDKAMTRDHRVGAPDMNIHFSSYD
jgi:hypothetical protein